MVKGLGTEKASFIFNSRFLATRLLLASFLMWGKVPFCIENLPTVLARHMLCRIMGLQVRVQPTQSRESPGTTRMSTRKFILVHMGLHMSSQLLIITKGLVTLGTNKRSDIHMLRSDMRPDSSTISKTLVAERTLYIIMLNCLQDMLYLILLIMSASIPKPAKTSTCRS